MKLTNAQVQMIEEALLLAHYPHMHATYEPQRGRVEALMDDICRIVKLVPAEGQEEIFRKGE